MRQYQHTELLLSYYLKSTVSGVTEDKALQIPPLCVQPLHQFEGIHRVSQEALRVLCGCGCQGIQLVSPPITKKVIKL